MLNISHINCLTKNIFQHAYNQYFSSKINKILPVRKCLNYLVQHTRFHIACLWQNKGQTKNCPIGKIFHCWNSLLGLYRKHIAQKRKLRQLKQIQLKMQWPFIKLAIEPEKLQKAIHTELLNQCIRNNFELKTTKTRCFNSCM